MLINETLQQLQTYNFDLLARQELNGQRRMRYIALGHLKAPHYTQLNWSPPVP